MDDGKIIDMFFAREMRTPSGIPMPPTGDGCIIWQTGSWKTVRTRRKASAIPT